MNLTDEKNENYLKNVDNSLKYCNKCPSENKRKANVKYRNQPVCKFLILLLK